MNEDSPASPLPRPFQFRLRTVFVLTTLAALLTWAALLFPTVLEVTLVLAAALASIALSLVFIAFECVLISVFVRAAATGWRAMQFVVGSVAGVFQWLLKSALR